MSDAEKHNSLMIGTFLKQTQVLLETLKSAQETLVTMQLRLDGTDERVRALEDRMSTMEGH